MAFGTIFRAKSLNHIVHQITMLWNKTEIRAASKAAKEAIKIWDRGKVKRLLPVRVHKVALPVPIWDLRKIKGLSAPPVRTAPVTPVGEI
jgi:hypothetical protein